MHSLTTRRSFLRTGTALVLPWLAPQQGARTPPVGLPTPLPRVDGAFLADEEALRAASDDWTQR